MKWLESKTFAFFFKLSSEDAESTGIPFIKYETQWKDVICTINPGETKGEDYLPFFKKAYFYMVGE